MVPNKSRRVLRRKKTTWCQISLGGFPLLSNLDLSIYIYNIFYHLPKFDTKGIGAFKCVSFFFILNGSKRAREAILVLIGIGHFLLLLRVGTHEPGVPTRAHRSSTAERRNTRFLGEKEHPFPHPPPSVVTKRVPINTNLSLRSSMVVEGRKSSTSSASQ